MHNRHRVRGRELRLTIRGRPAVVVLAAILSGFVLNAAIARETLPDGGLEAIRQGLSLEYRLNRAQGLQSGHISRQAAVALDRDLKNLRNKVEIRSVSAKGWFFSRIVRVEVRVDGHTPPDGRLVRYLYLSCDPVIGCLVLDEVPRIHYTLGLWFKDPPAASFPRIH